MKHLIICFWFKHLVIWIKPCMSSCFKRFQLSFVQVGSLSGHVATGENMSISFSACGRISIELQLQVALMRTMPKRDELFEEVFPQEIHRGAYQTSCSYPSCMNHTSSTSISSSLDREKLFALLYIPFKINRNCLFVLFKKA